MRPRASACSREKPVVGEMFETWSYESEQPFSVEALRDMVRRELPASIYRCKGIVFSDEFPEKRFALQAVGRRVEIMELDEWGERTPQSRLVAIGSTFDACLTHS